MSDVQNFVLRLNGEKMLFESHETLSAYLALQIKHWKWLAKLPEPYKDAGEAIFETYFLNPIHEVETHAIDLVSPELRLGNDKMPFILYDSDEGYLTSKTREEYGDVTAALTVVYLNNHTRSAIHRNGKISSFAQNDRLSFERSIAIQIAISLKGFSAIGSDARSSAMRETLERFVSHAELATDAVNNYVTDIIDSAASSKSDIDDLAESLTATYTRRRKRYKAYMIRVRNSARTAVTEATTTLASAKNAYHDQVDLDASVQYWSARRRNHSIYKVVWFFAILLSMTVMFISVLGYYGAGGAAGLSNLMHEQRVENATLSQELSTTPPSSPTPIEPTATSLTPSASINLVSHTRSEISLAVADLAGAALLITLLGILIKITLRQFNTHSHLALEAEERITFTKTYLALLNEGKLKSDEDRKLVLESLFRSTKSGATEEIPFSSPLELILKTIGDKKQA
ncbi:DUF6161 domain-containing protein [Pseudomonas fluorescens]|uniref:DUF6161 domain-containing protein n=1 Tax=Pseudomonas fluorescens TaxID=294 RepID=UPI000ADAAE46|nr:DUF6161 domain-containing protein [Pseudomonas fluorescens]